MENGDSLEELASTLKKVQDFSSELIEEGTNATTLSAALLVWGTHIAKSFLQRSDDELLEMINACVKTSNLIDQNVKRNTC